MLTAQTTTLISGFTGSTLDAGWAVGGTGYSPVLTASAAGGNIDSAGHGWLRLTSAGTNQATYAYDARAFASANATITATFNYVSYGGSGADGISFFLADASQTFSVGAYGGSLGYAQKTTAGGGGADINGMNGGYIGLGIDEFGNYANPTEGRAGGLGDTRDAVSVRGPGSGLSGYNYLGGTGTLPISLDTPSVASRSSATVTTYKVIITATNQLTVYADFGANGTFVALYSIDISGYARPEELIMGFTGSTGDSTNIHEVQKVSLTSVVADLWTNANGDSKWGTGNDWYGSPTGMVPSNYADILLDNTYVNTAQTINVASNRIIRSLQVDAPFGYTLNNGTLTFDKHNVEGPSGIYVSQTHGSANHTVNSAIALNNAIEIQNNSAGSLTLGGNVTTGGYGINFNGHGVTSLSGIVSGTGALTQSGTGTTTLSGVNTYSGGTTISAGRLNANSSTALGTGSVDLNGGILGSTNGSSINRAIALNASSGLAGITTSGTLTQTGGSYTLNMAGATQSGAVKLSDSNTARTLTVQVDSGTSKISGVIANGGNSAGSLTKTGAGTLELSGANTYTGTTTINAGTVQLGANNVFSDSSALNISGGNLNLNGYSDRVGNLTFSDGATLDFGATATNNSFVFANLTPDPSGVLTINNYVGPDSSNWSGSGDFLGTTKRNISSSLLNQIYFSGYGTGSVENTRQTNAGNGLGNAYRIAPVAVNWTNYTWKSNGTDSNSQQWTRGSNWQGGTAPPNKSDPTNVFVNFGTGSQANANFNDNSTINALRFSSSAIAYTISGSKTLTFQNKGTITYVQQQSANNQTLSPGSIVIKDNMVFDITGAGNLTVGSAITDGSSSYSLTKVGSGGKLILTQANTYDGGTSIQSGTVQIQNSGALGSGTVTVSDGATLELVGGISPSKAISLSGTGVNAGGALKNVSGANTVSGIVTLAADTSIQSDAGIITFTSGITGSDKNLTLTGAGNIDVSSAITTRTGGVILNGAGTVTFNGGTANTYTGDTIVNSGTLVLSKPPVGSTATTAVAGNLVVNGGTVNQTTSNQIADTSTVTVNSGSYNLTGAGSISQTIQTVTTASGSTISIGSSDSVIINGTGVSNINGTITGAGALVTAGTGSVYLGAANSYTGGTTIGSVVTAANSSSLGTGAATVGTGGNLQLQGGVSLANNFTINGTGTTANDGSFENISGNNTVSGSVTLGAASRIQSGSGSLTLSGTTALSTHTLNVGGSGNTTISGGVSGSASTAITKDGSGTLTLSGSTANSFTGGLQINQGTVVLNKIAGTNATGGGTITVGDNAGSYDTAKLKWGANNQLPDSTRITMNSDGVIDLNGFKDTVGSVAGSGHIMVGTGQLIAGGDNTSTTFSGVMTGSDDGVFTKTGTGTLTLSSSSRNGGEISYGGEFNLNAGTLALDDINLTVDTLRLTGTSVLDFGGSSTLTVGTLIIELTGGETLSITSWEQWVDYFYADAVQNGDGTVIPGRDIHGDAPLNNIIFAGWTGDNTKWQGWDSQITPVPEASSYGALLVSGLIGLVACRRRRRQW